MISLRAADIGLVHLSVKVHVCTEVNECTCRRRSDYRVTTATCLHCKKVSVYPRTYGSNELCVIVPLIYGHTGVHGTGSVEIWKTRHRRDPSICGYFFTV